jgi:hypothetical protein
MAVATIVTGSDAWVAAQEASATCTSVGLDTARTWRFDTRGDRWQVTHWRGTLEKDAVRLTMPANARARWSRQAVAFTARTSNGGIDVSLTGSPASARLDIYVSYELEVNVDSSLTPAIDDLNTEGPIGVRCEIRGA